MNGEMADSVSPGSSQRGASVTCAAMLTWPSGAASSEAGTAEASVRERTITALRRAARLVEIIVESPCAEGYSTPPPLLTDARCDSFWEGSSARTRTERRLRRLLSSTRVLTPPPPALAPPALHE